MKLFKDRKTGEVYVQIFDGNFMAVSAYDNRIINLDETDVDEIPVTPTCKNTYKIEHIVEEESTAAELTEREYHLKDVVHIPINDNDIAFRVEHIEDCGEYNKVYFVAVDAVGKSSMDDMAEFLENFENKLPKDLVSILSDIEHATENHTHRSKVSLLSLANVGCDDGDYCSGADDIEFDGLLTEAERCKNFNGETRWYWLDTEYASNSTYFYNVGTSGYAGYGSTASSTYAVVPCLSIKQKKHTK